LGTITVDICTNGVYHASYNTTKAQARKIWIYFNGQGIHGNPYNTSISPGPVYPQNTILSGAFSGTIRNASNSFTMQAVDFWGNMITHGGDDFGADFQPNCNNASYSKTTDNDDGTYTCSYVLNNGGVFCLEILFNNSVISDSNPNQEKYYYSMGAQDGFVHSVYLVGGGGCNGECNGNGICSNGTCYCQDGFTGASCTPIPNPPPEKKV